MPGYAGRDAGPYSEAHQGSDPSQWETRAASSLQALGFNLTEARACFDPVRSFVGSNWAKLHRKEAASAVTLCCGGCWTKTRARLAGYALGKVLCDLCGAEDDTAAHRLWRCSGTAHLRAGKYIAQVARAAKDAGNDPLCLRAFFGHPGKRPADVPVDGAPRWVKVDPEQGDEPPKGSDSIFVDGSFERCVIWDRSVAAWCAVIVDANSKPLWRYEGLVPPHCPPSAPAAEQTGLLRVNDIVSVASHVFSDCLSVVTSAGRPAASRTAQFAGLPLVPK